MSLCKSGQIQNCCHPNALMTLKEYLVDYAKPFTRETGERLIEKEIPSIPNGKIREKIRLWLSDIEEGKRDFRI
jgi:2-iminoacetate synthase